MTRTARKPILLTLVAALAAAVPQTASAGAISLADASDGIAVGVKRVQGTGASVLLDGTLVGSLDRPGKVLIGGDLLRGRAHVVTVRSVGGNRTTITRLAASATATRSAGRAAAFLDAPPSVTTDRAARWSFAVPAGTRALCRVDLAPTRACSSGSFSARGLALGTHTFTLELRATAQARPAGRLRAAAKTGSTTQSWKVVSPAPSISIQTAPSATTTGTTASFGWTVSDRRAKVSCKRDGAAYADCDGATKLSGLALGDHTFVISATNDGGTATKTIAWKVTSPTPPPTTTTTTPPPPTTTTPPPTTTTPPPPTATPPTITLTQKPLARTTSTSASLAWTTGGTVAAVTCSVDGATAAACATPLALTGLAKGAHSVVVTATGPQGSASATANWSVVTRAIMWGAYVNGAQYGFSNPPWDMRGLDRFESYAGGKHVSILHFGQPWYVGGVAQRFFPGPLNAVRDRGAIPLVDWNSWELRDSGSATQPAFALARILDGTHDAYIRLWATGARDWGHPFFLRFDHEMNGDWYPWSEKANGNTTGQYAAAWRHVRDIFEQVGATNVTWVWSPNTEYAGSIPLDGLYPGDAYVDWVAIDGYNWGTNPKKPYGWKSFSQVFKPTYDKLGALAPTKPVMIAEVATSEYGGDKAAWIKDALEVQIPDVFTRVQAVAWFNWQPEGIDWNIESSTASASAFAAGIGSQSYSGADFAALAGGRIQPLAG